MTRRSFNDWLDDIALWGDRLEAHLDATEWKHFLSNTMMQDAVSKCVESIGEACGRLDALDPDLGERHFGNRLKQAYRSRNRLSHGYFQIDLAILWQTAVHDIPQLVKTAKALKELRAPGSRG